MDNTKSDPKPHYMQEMYQALFVERNPQKYNDICKAGLDDVMGHVTRMLTNENYNIVDEPLIVAALQLLAASMESMMDEDSKHLKNHILQISHVCCIPAGLYVNSNKDPDDETDE